MREKSVINPIDIHVGNRVRMRRIMLGMSQTKLGDAFGLTFQQVQKYEKGTNRISASRLQQCANTLQVPVAFFFEGAPSVPGVPQAKGTAPRNRRLSAQASAEQRSVNSHDTVCRDRLARSIRSGIR